MAGNERNGYRYGPGDEHIFDVDKEIGRWGEIVLDDALRASYFPRPVPYAQQRRGIDREVLTGDRTWHTVEYKTQFTARPEERDCPVYIETVSTGSTDDDGWGYRSEAEFFLIYLPNIPIVLELQSSIVRQNLTGWRHTYGFTRQWNGRYFSCAVPVPLDVLGSFASWHVQIEVPWAVDPDALAEIAATHNAARRLGRGDLFLLREMFPDRYVGLPPSGVWFCDHPIADAFDEGELFDQTQTQQEWLTHIIQLSKALVWKVASPASLGWADVSWSRLLLHRNRSPVFVVEPVAEGWPPSEAQELSAAQLRADGIDIYSPCWPSDGEVLFQILAAPTGTISFHREMQQLHDGSPSHAFGRALWNAMHNREDLGLFRQSSFGPLIDDAGSR